MSRGGFDRRRPSARHGRRPIIRPHSRIARRCRVVTPGDPPVTGKPQPAQLIRMTPRAVEIHCERRSGSAHRPALPNRFRREGKLRDELGNMAFARTPRGRRRSGEARGYRRQRGSRWPGAALPGDLRSCPRRRGRVGSARRGMGARGRENGRRAGPDRGGGRVMRPVRMGTGRRHGRGPRRLHRGSQVAPDELGQPLFDGEQTLLGAGGEVTAGRN